MVKAIKCDKCKEIKNKGMELQWNRRGNPLDAHTLGEWDLCSKCFEKFQKWLKSKED